jgi:Tol biopolymer transport system component
MVAILLAAIGTSLMLAAGATAGGPAKAGSTFSTGYVTLPKGAIPGGNSGASEFSFEAGSLSQNGRYVAFASGMNALSRAAAPDSVNAFWKDRQTGAVQFVGRASGNGPGPAEGSTSPRISGDGKRVGFMTTAKLDPADADEKIDVYIRNLQTDETTLATPGTAEDVFQYDLSTDGQYIAFTSQEVLSGTDVNNTTDVFRRNLISGVTDLASRVPASATAGNGYSDSPSISGDGRWVAFRSAATTLVAGFVNSNGAAPDVFARDMVGNQNFLISAKFDLATTGGNGESSEPAIAGFPGGSGEVKVAYSSYSTNIATGGVDASNASSVYIRASLATAPSNLVSQSTGGVNADSRAHTPAISDNGNLITFSSDAGNLGAGLDYYGTYLRNVGGSTTTLASARNEYAIAGDVSGDGSIVTWVEEGGATPDSDPDLFGVFARTTPVGPIELVSRPPGTKLLRNPGAIVYEPSPGVRTLNANGRYFAFAALSSRLGTEGEYEVFRRDLATGALKLVSRVSGVNGAKSGGSRAATISNDGTRVAFISNNPLVPADTDDQSDVYVRDLPSNTTILVSRANGPDGADADGYMGGAAISGNGKRVAFTTASTNLDTPGGKEQIFVRDLDTGTTTLASRATGLMGAAGNGDSNGVSIDNSGDVVAFRSVSSNLDPADAATNSDVFVRNLGTQTTVLVSREPGLGGGTTPDPEYDAALSGDGKVVAFRTEAEALAPGTGPWEPMTEQVIARVIATGANTLVSMSAGGLAGNAQSGAPAINRDGSVIAFESTSTNLIPGLGGGNRDAIIVRDMNSGKLSGPPAFGPVSITSQTRAHGPSISDNGRCVAFNGYGHNDVSGDLGDLPGSYVFVASGTCPDPRGLAKPKLSGVKVTARNLTWRLNVRATVTVSFARRKAGGFKPAGRIVRKNQKAGKRVLRWRGKVGGKALKPGVYRVTLRAKNVSGASRQVRRKLIIRG